jgi:hypothetical protein
MHAQHYSEHTLPKPKLRQTSYWLQAQLLLLLLHSSSRLGLGGELGLVDVDALPRGALAAGLVVGAQAALPPHLAVPLLPQLLPPRLAAAAAPCTDI